MQLICKKKNTKIGGGHSQQVNGDNYIQSKHMKIFEDGTHIWYFPFILITITIFCICP